MMLLEKFSLTTVIIGTTALTLLANIVPAIAQAATYKGTLNLFSASGTQLYTSEFFLSTNVGTSNPNANPVTFNLAISGYKATSLLTGASFSAPKRSRPDLKAVRFSDTKAGLPEDLRVSFENFNPFEGPFYEYGFSIGNYNTITGILGTAPFPFTNEGGQATVKFYIPTDFIYSGEFGTFTIPSSGSLTQADNTYKKTLTGFQNILQQAQGSRVLQFRVPTNVIVAGVNPQTSDIPPRAILEFDTTPIPESNPSAGLIGLGLIGGYVIVKRKSTKA